MRATAARAEQARRCYVIVDYLIRRHAFAAARLMPDCARAYLLIDTRDAP